MTSLLASLGIFAVAFVVGMAVLGLLAERDADGATRIAMRRVLLAPSVGFCVFMLPTLWLNLAGLPVSVFALAVLTAIGVLTVAALVVRRPVLPVRACLGFGAILLAALLLSGSPMLQYGVGWLSFANPDMVNYTLGAQRLLHQGFAAVPNEHAWNTLQDGSLYYWSLYAVNNIRTGVEELLALAAYALHAETLVTFMPLILAFHVAVIAAAAALVYRGKRGPLAAALTAAALGVSALWTYGIVSQLIAQVAGIALMLATLAALDELMKGPNPRDVVLTALLAAGTCAVYPEVSPFVVVAGGLYAVASLVGSERPRRPVLYAIAGATVLTAALLNYDLRMVLATLATQVVHGTDNTVELGMRPLFWYFLVPTGPAALFGLVQLATSPDDSSVSAYVVAGFALLALYSAVLVAELRRREPMAYLGVTMLVLAFFLFARTSDFGLFKLAMYIQPPIVGVTALAVAGVLTSWGERWRADGRLGPVTPRRFAVGFALVLCVAALVKNVAVQQFYVERSRGTGASAAFTEVANASEGRIVQTLRSLHSRLHPADTVVSDAWNIVVAELESTYTVGHEAVFPSDDYFGNIMTVELGKDRSLMKLLQDPRLEAKRLELVLRRRARFDRMIWFFADARGTSTRAQFTQDRALGEIKRRGSPSQMILSAPGQSVLNRWGAAIKSDGVQLTMMPYSLVHDHLIFVDSSLGGSYFSPPVRATLFQLEPDPLEAHTSMEGVGRSMIVQAINPSPDARLVIRLTNTLNGDGENKLPPALVLGERAERLPFAGRGSARVATGVIKPRRFGAASYFIIDLGVDGKKFPVRRRGLMNLYGRDFVLDPRKLAAFALDISVVSDRKIRAARPPQAIARFPGDLKNDALFYSGLYEDGWCSEHVTSRLSLAKRGMTLRLAGLIPQIKDPAYLTELTVRIDDREVAKALYGVGNFDLTIPVPPGIAPGPHDVDVSSSAVQKLPDDGRPVAALLSFFGFR